MKPSKSPTTRFPLYVIGLDKDLFNNVSDDQDFSRVLFEKVIIFELSSTTIIRPLVITGE